MATLADLDLQSLVLLVMALVIAIVISGFINAMVLRLSSPQQYRPLPPQKSPKAHQKFNKARVSSANLPDSLTPNVSKNLNPNQPNQSQKLLRNPNHVRLVTSPLHQQNPNMSNTSPSVPLLGQLPSNTYSYGPSPPYHQNVFQYPNPIQNMLNTTISNGFHRIPPAPNPAQSLPPTQSNSLSPLKQPSQPQTYPKNKITELLNEQYQPKKGNISNLRKTQLTRTPRAQDSQSQPLTPNPNQYTNPQKFGSSHKLAFDRLDQEITKFPVHTSMRAADHIQSMNEFKDDNGNVTTEFITRSPEPTHTHETMGNGSVHAQTGKRMDFFAMAEQNNDAPKPFSPVRMTQKRSFPDDITPNSLLTPPQSPPSVSSTGSDHYGGVNGQRQKVIIVCYKLPLKCTYNKETTKWDMEWEDIRNVLANLRVLQSSDEYEVSFVGWPGVTPTSLDEQDNLEDALYALKYPCYPIFLTDSQIKNCYKVYCRSILWPLFHYLMPTNDYHFGNNYEKYWQSYVGLNNLYAKKACVAATDNDHHNNSDFELKNEDSIIWFHDYHLLLAPHFVRRQIPLAQIGLFVHTTFPTSEVFRCLPTRKEILRGILSSDLVGFHTYDYARHFLSACKRILDLDFHTLPDNGQLAVHYLGRDVSLRIGHASILSHDIHKTAQSQKVKNIRTTFWKKKLNMRNKKIILGLGELDEVRGTILTIQSFYNFLSAHPEWQNDVIFILCISSSTLDLSTYSHLTSFNSIKMTHNLARSRSYSNLRKPIEDEINKMKHQFNSDVIQLIDSNNLSYNELLALYSLCDVAVFGTFWDGFNTVPYEFTAAQPSYNIYNAHSHSYSGDTDIDDERGVPPAVILSEFMGCMRSLCGVFRINPWKISEVASTLHTALCMTSKERRVAHHRRFSHVMKYTLLDWSIGFINDLIKAAKSERNKRVLPIGFGSNLRFIYIPNDLTNLKQSQKLLTNSFKSCKYKILLFDYGGTLTDVDEMTGVTDDDDDRKQSRSNDTVDSYRDLLGITKDLQSISPKILRNLQRISSAPNTVVAIVSGQTRENLQKAFASCPQLLICAEKGAWFRYPGQSHNWVKNEKLIGSNPSQWKTIVLDVLQTYTERTNGSYIQEKSTAVVWHYENSDPRYGDMQATEVERYLRRILEKHHNLLIQRYDHARVLEVLPKEIHKGSATLKVIDDMMQHIQYNNDDTTGNNIFMMAVGNDRSDEKMFEAVELASKEINTEYGFTVRIGMVPTQARFYLTDQNQMVWVLNTLSSIAMQQSLEGQSPSQFQALSQPFNSVPIPDNTVASLSHSNIISEQARNIPKPSGMSARKSHSYSRGLSAVSQSNDNNESSNNGNEFQPLIKIQRSIDQIPIPPTAPNNPMGISEYNHQIATMDRQNKILHKIQNTQNINFDLVSPEYSGSFFDNVAVRSHSYTSLSRLAKLTELTEQVSASDSYKNLSRRGSNQNMQSEKNSD